MQRRRSAKYPEDGCDGVISKNMDMLLNIIIDLLIVCFMIQCCSAAWYSLLDRSNYHLVTQLGLTALCYKALFCYNVWVEQFTRGSKCRR